MARPSNTDSSETRTRILDSAALLFSEHGVGSTSIRDVAGAANVSSAMVSHYFGSKDSMYSECIERTFHELLEMKALLEIELGKNVDLSELFGNAVRTAFRFACSRRTAVRLLVRAAVSTGELLPYGRKLLLDTMTLVTSVLGARLGRPAEELRLPLQSIVFLIARYAAQAETELVLVVGVSPKQKAEARSKVEDHLVKLALDLFGIPKIKSSKHTKRSSS